jgi:hypothetical protein
MSTTGRRRRRALTTIALALLIVAVPLAVYTWGRESGTFQVRHVVVAGQRSAHTKVLRAVLRQRFLGVNLFLVSTARVRAALAGFPYVDRVVIDRDFPDTLRVRMTEYVPAALLLSAGRWYVVSSGGRVLAQASTSAAGSSPSSRASPTTGSSPGANGAPTTSGSPIASISPAASGSPVAGATTTGLPAGQPSASSTAKPEISSTTLPQPAASVGLPRGARHLPVVVSSAPATVGTTVADPYARQALTVLAALPVAMRRGALGARASDTSIRVYVAGGPTIEFGDTGGLAAKVLSLKAVLARYRARHIACTYVDVSVPDRPLGAPLLPAPAVQAGTPGSTPSTTPSGAPASSATGTPGATTSPAP